ncbi:unnamed protein product, partial [Mesorhabditis spiculigera]
MGRENSSDVIFAILVNGTEPLSGNLSNMSMHEHGTPGERSLLENWVYLILMPIVCIWGIVAALLCIVVFTRPRMRSSLNLYLAGLSVFDFLVLLSSLLTYPSLQLCVVNDHSTDSLSCQFFWKSALLTLPLSNIFQAGSVWTCVAVTVDRFLAVNYPLHSKIWCTPKRAVVIMGALTTFIFFYKIPQFFELVLDEDGRLGASEMRQNDYYKMWYTNYSYLAIVVLIPWMIMIVLNTKVVLTVHQAYKIRKNLNSNTAGREERDRRCTLMAVVMIMTFIFFNILSTLVNFMETFEFGQSFRTQLTVVGNFLVCLNSASNIIVYSLFGRRFRQMCLKMLCGRMRRFPITHAVISEWERDTMTRRTSVEPSIAMMSARGSRRYSKRISLRMLDGPSAVITEKRASFNRLLPEARPR